MSKSDQKIDVSTSYGYTVMVVVVMGCVAAVHAVQKQEKHITRYHHRHPCGVKKRWNDFFTKFSTPRHGNLFRESKRQKSKQVRCLVG